MEHGPDTHQTVKREIQKQTMEKVEAVGAKTKDLESSRVQNAKKCISRGKDMKRQGNHKNGGP